MLERLGPMFNTFLGLLMEQYKDSPNMLGILEAMAYEFDLLDQAMVELDFELLNIDDSVGVQLDMLGRLANLPRLGRSDDLYRAAIRIAFRTHNSGTPEQILSAVKDLTGSTDIEYIPFYPAGYWLVYNGLGLTRELLQQISPAGVLGYPGCFLCDIHGDFITTMDSDPILVVGPCEPVGGGAILLEVGGGVLLTETNETLLMEE